MTGLIDPADGAEVLTPNDNADLAFVTRGIWVGVSGNVKVDMASGDTLTFVGMAEGVIHPLRVKRVYSTGTDATDIIGIK